MEREGCRGGVEILSKGQGRPLEKGTLREAREEPCDSWRQWSSVGDLASQGHLANFWRHFYYYRCPISFGGGMLRNLVGRARDSAKQPSYSAQDKVPRTKNDLVQNVNGVAVAWTLLKGSRYLKIFILTTRLWNRYYHVHFTGKGAEAQRIWVTCPGHTPEQWLKPSLCHLAERPRTF